MNTKFIGVKDFRQSIAEYAKRAQSGTDRYVVMNRNQPLFEIKPFTKNDTIDSCVAEVLAAEQAVQQGEVYSEADVLKQLGLA